MPFVRREVTDWYGFDIQITGFPNRDMHPTLGIRTRPTGTTQWKVLVVADLVLATELREFADETNDEEIP